MRREYSETPISELPDRHIPLAELRSEWNTRTPEQWGLPNGAGAVILAVNHRPTAALW